MLIGTVVAFAETVPALAIGLSESSSSGVAERGKIRTKPRSP